MEKGVVYSFRSKELTKAKNKTKCGHIALEKLVQRNDIQKELNAVCIHSKRKRNPLDFKKLELQKRS